MGSKNQLLLRTFPTHLSHKGTSIKCGLYITTKQVSPVHFYLGPERENIYLLPTIAFRDNRVLVIWYVFRLP